MKKTFTFCTILLFPVLMFAASAKTGDLQYIQNNGQWNSAVLFKADLYGGAVFLEKNCLTWNFSNITELTQHGDHKTQATDSVKLLKGHAFKTYFLNANENVTASGATKYENFYNYFLGRDKNKWKGNVPAYASVEYHNLYENIDAHIYSYDNNLKYDFIVHPHADVTNIQLQYDGLDRVEIIDGNLELTTSINRIAELHPVAYQIINGMQHLVECNFSLNGNILSFDFPNGYNSNADLVIDPATLIFASYTGSTADNWGYTATYDEEGNLYGGGIVFGTGYPIITGSYQEVFGGGDPMSYSGGCDIGISKFNPDGTSLIYSTYLGGAHEELPHSLIVNNAGELLVFGTTGSDDFPTTAGAYDASFNGGDYVGVDGGSIVFSEGQDMYIATLSDDGSELIASTYLGGNQTDGSNLASEIQYNYGDFARGEVIVDADDNVYIASSTNSNDFPVTAGVFQNSKSAGQDGVVCKLNPALSNLLWSTYIGGSGSDGAYSLKRDSEGNILVCGGTSSTNFPASSGAWNETYKGGTADGWLAKFNTSASDVTACTYIGTNQYDQAYFVEVDNENGVYVTGQTNGSYPVINADFSNPGSSQFITKLFSDLSDAEYSTVFGSGTSTINISPSAFLVDTCQNVYVSGWGGNVNVTGNTSGMEVTGDAVQPDTDGSDFYFIVMHKNATSLVYATYFGGNGSVGEHVDGGTSRFDKNGRIYQAVCAGCGSSDAFPVTDGAYSETNGSSNCNLGVIKFEFNFPGPTAGASSESSLNGCAPFTLTFQNESEMATEYDWDFGDGASSTLENPEHTYDDPGTYTVTLIATDPEACHPTDTTTLTVEVYEIPEPFITIGPDSISIYGVATFTDYTENAVSWLWDFGDGGTSTQQNPNHQYAEPGDYTVCLTVTNQFGCTDSACYPITVYAKSVLDAPNAFSPNGDGINDTYRPFSYGMEFYELYIYNRWGQLVFQTNDPDIGWDGVFNGKEQEMDTYAFYMNGKGTDGKTYYKQGNVTLVR